MTQRLVPADMAAAMTALGMRLGKVDDDEVWALCPAHEKRTGRKDSKPTNFSVNRDTGMASCFACGFKGDIATVVMYVLDCDMWTASGWLRANGASLVDQWDRVRTKIAERKEGRNDTSPGVHPDDPDLNFVLFGDAPDSALDARGLDRTSVDHYECRWDHEYDAWVLPMHGRRGRVDGWQLKAGGWVRNRPYGIKKSEYLFGSKVFDGDVMYVVESPLDAVRIHASGYDGAVATFGAKVSHQQVRMMLSLTDHVVLAFDNDPAGWQATSWMVDRLRGRVTVEVVDYDGYEEGDDPGALTDLEIRRLLNTPKTGLLWRSPVS